MPKRMFKDDVYESYTTASNALENEIKEGITPIIEKYIKLGYNVREITQVATAASELVCMMLLAKKITKYHLITTHHLKK